MLARIDAAVDDGTVAEGTPPVAGRGDGLDRAVGVGHPHLREERGLGAVEARLEAVESVLLGVPGAGDRRAEDVLALADHRGDIDSLVYEPVAVARPARRQNVV